MVVDIAMALQLLRLVIQNEQNNFAPHHGIKVNPLVRRNPLCETLRLRPRLTSVERESLKAVVLFGCRGSLLRFLFCAAGLLVFLF